ncbi:carboxylesterase [Loktanella sp. IMCC34160]|uniref:holin family protein n=1 Tax=Loktanella sp. IMCC34160 TaxID=2510646 RepID=UPI00101BAABC|nr:holin family protein [Loktanella sp. IMCC34160]RYG92070.1 carboxylesterase [Loktanella sp. IMCC34160]
MGLMSNILGVLFGDGRNVVVETMGAFRENAEAGAARDAHAKSESLSQFAAEFAHPRKGIFDRFIDGLNRLPRPLLAFGTLGLFVMAMVDPIWFASRMQGIALVPEPLWWLMGAIVSFYFGARHQAKAQEFQQSVVLTAAQAGEVSRRVRAIEALGAGAALTAPGTPEEQAEEALALAPNPALTDWRSARDDQ